MQYRLSSNAPLLLFGLPHLKGRDRNALSIGMHKPLILLDAGAFAAQLLFFYRTLHTEVSF